MISTQILKTIAAKVPANTTNTFFANVLTWHPPQHPNGSKFFTLSPYYLKTDGLEEQVNDGGVLFENFWQGSKVWPTYYDIKVWAHPNLEGNPKHLWFSYKCANGIGSETHFDGNSVQPQYFEWRREIFSCKRPVRYPNGRGRRNQVVFTLLQTKDGSNERLDYITARKRIYVQEYGRLVRQLPEFWDLCEIVCEDGKNLVICEVDVPQSTQMTIPLLEALVEDPKVCFGHGLCLAWELLKCQQNGESRPF